MAQQLPTLLTQAEYARHRKERGLPGGSREAVRKAVDEGRISIRDGKIDPVVADKQWERNTRARLSPQAAAGVSADEAKPDLVGLASAAPSEPPAAAPAPVPDTGYSMARARREVAEAEQAEIELQRKKGELVLRVDVDRAFLEITREIRDRLMATARRTAAEVSSLQSAEACEAVIDREHRIALELLVQSFREKVGASPRTAAA